MLQESPFATPMPLPGGIGVRSNRCRKRVGWWQELAAGMICAYLGGSFENLEIFFVFGLIAAVFLSVEKINVKNW